MCVSECVRVFKDNVCMFTSQERMNIVQKERLVENMTEKFLFLQGRHATGTSVHSRRLEWNNLAAELNTLGPPKSEARWRNAWRNVKSKVRFFFIVGLKSSKKN